MGRVSGPQCHPIEDCGGKQAGKGNQGTCMEGRMGWELRATWLCSRGGWKLLLKPWLQKMVLLPMETP